jgi:hypothetical protein
MKITQGMRDINFGVTGGPSFNHVLKHDTVLSDKDFSNKDNVLAKAGETVRIQHLRNYGSVWHPVHGFFRY